jgi:hypothetical protein
MAAREAEILAIPYFHVVFTLPGDACRHAYQDFCSGIDLDRAKNANRTPFAFAVVSTVGTCMM